MYGSKTIHTISIGGSPALAVGLAAVANFRLDATSDELAYIHRCSHDLTINQVAFEVATLTGTPTYQVSLQSVTATTGDPTGTILGGGSPASTQWAAAAGWNWITLDNSYAVSKEDVIAIVIEDGTSGTNPDGSNYIDVSRHDTQILQSAPPFAVQSTDTGSTWTPIGSDTPMYGLRNSGDTADVQGYPVQAPFVQPANLATSTGHVAGAAFMLPESFGRRVQVHGFNAGFVFIDNLFTGGIFAEDGTAVIESAQIDNNTSESNFNNPLIYFTPTWLETGVKYYAGIQKENGTGTGFYYTHLCDAAATLSAFTGYPNNAYATWRGTSWLDENAIAGSCVLFVSAWDKHGQEMQHLEKGMSR